MKKLADQLQSVSKFLVHLSKQVDKITAQLDRHQTAKKAPVKKPESSKKGAPDALKVEVKSEKVLDSVYGVIKRNKKGVSIAKLRETTGLGSRQISNALYKLTKKGAIKTLSRGIYVPK